MSHKPQIRLNPRKRYLQVALNSDLEDARAIIARLPVSDRIIVEVGTPLIKEHGADAIRQIREWYTYRLAGQNIAASVTTTSIPPALKVLLSLLVGSQWQHFVSTTKKQKLPSSDINPYIVADLKTMDRGEREVRLAAEAGASAAVALGTAPTETLNVFIATCQRHGLDAMVDMMNVEFPLMVLQKLKQIPPVVILHRGVDEEQLNRAKQLPLNQIRLLKGTYNIMIAIAGGDTLREVQRAIFNDADIVVIWKSVYHQTTDTVRLITDFLKEIK
ncbi:MAG: hypothetical protein HY372_03620 [Candidatus Andersenbacteria bacterium]|nr:hypothetical protein [Candidatus Andersenbacteria bacterium]